MSQTQTSKVYVQGPAFYGSTVSVFRKAGFEITESLRDSNIVVLTGGQDINPGIYKQRPIPGTYFSLERDEVDCRAVERGMKEGKFMVGICRGAQLLNCYNGGTLWQNVDRHHGVHPMTDLVSKKQLPAILSVHHQMMRMGPDGELVAVAYQSTFKSDADGSIISAGETPHGDPEVIWYPKTRSLCFQSHPEFGHPETTAYFFDDLMKRYYNESLQR